jgi:hypothetical protein
MTILDGVPVKTRVPASGWALAALFTLFSLLSSLIADGGTGHVYQASMTQLLGFVEAFYEPSEPRSRFLFGLVQARL